MVRLMLSGCSGHMGQSVAALSASEPDLELTVGVDLLGAPGAAFPVLPSPAHCKGVVDVVLDFSSPAALEGLLSFCEERAIPLVLCTTGHSPAQLAAIEAAAQHIPIFRSANMALGVELLRQLTEQVCAVLSEDFDIEIVESHHRRKADAPSGTALMLAHTVKAARPQQMRIVCNRQDLRTPRSPQEIGIASIRGGGISGEHRVLFAGSHEVITLCHSALDREVFAVGALQAVKFMARVREPGLYTMSDLLKQLRHSKPGF